MKTATFVRKLDGFTGDARLYSLSEPIGNKYSHVVVSATVVPFGIGPETYIFPADVDGKVIDWGELDGSFRGALDHEQALNDAGYSVA